MITVHGVMGSINAHTGDKIVTILATYPRSIHAQLLTHRMFNKNSSSSRAIPTITEIENIENNPALIIWTQNQKGMQGQIINDTQRLGKINKLVLKHRQAAFELAKELSNPKTLNVHKQNVNRFLEPFANITVLITATEWENFDWLRCDKDTQPEMDLLANKLRDCRKNMDYMEIHDGEWHIPFVDRKRDAKGVLRYYGAGTDTELDVDTALKISLSCAAQTSFRKLDDSLEKAESIIEKLFGEKVHASPSEHQAKAVKFNAFAARFLPMYLVMKSLPKGITHIDTKFQLWSGPIKNFVQYRHLLPRTDKAKF